MIPTAPRRAAHCARGGRNCPGEPKRTDARDVSLKGEAGPSARAVRRPKKEPSMIAASICGFAVVVLAAQVPAPDSGPSPGARLRVEQRSILRDESAKLEALAARLAGQGR